MKRNRCELNFSFRVSSREAYVSRLVEMFDHAVGVMRMIFNQPGRKVPAQLQIKVEHGKQKKELPKLKLDIEESSTTYCGLKRKWS